MDEPDSGSWVESIGFRGHPMVRSLHRTTIEVTTEGSLTESGDCIVGVAADKGCAALSAELKAALRARDAKVTITLEVAGESFTFGARGDDGLELSHPHDVVIRRSGFLSDRTLAVRATAAAADVPRTMVRRLKDPMTDGVLRIEVRRP